MSSFNFHGPVNGPVQAGDHNTMNVNGPGASGDSPAASDARANEAVVALAQRLVDVLARENPGLLPQAEQVRAELERGGRQGAEAPDTGRIRQRLDLITSGTAAGSGALALVEGIVHAIGG